MRAKILPQKRYPETRPLFIYRAANSLGTSSASDFPPSSLFWNLFTRANCVFIHSEDWALVPGDGWAQKGVVTEATFICELFASRLFLKNNKSCHSNGEKKKEEEKEEGIFFFLINPFWNSVERPEEIYFRLNNVLELCVTFFSFHPTDGTFLLWNWIHFLYFHQKRKEAFFPPTRFSRWSVSVHLLSLGKTEKIT